MKKFIPALFILGFSSLIYAADGIITQIHPPGNGTGGMCHGRVAIIDESGNRFTAKTPFSNELSVQVDDTVSFDIQGKGRKAVNVTPVFGDPNLCYLSAEEFDELSLAGLQPCEVVLEPGVELDEATKHAIRNTARKLGEDNGPVGAQVVITKI